MMSDEEIKKEESATQNRAESLNDESVSWKNTSWRLFSVTFFFSLALHIVPFLLIVTGVLKFEKVDAQWEWMQDAGDLTGLGMESGGRWAELSTYNEPEQEIIDKPLNEETVEPDNIDEPEEIETKEEEEKTVPEPPKEKKKEDVKQPPIPKEAKDKKNQKKKTKKEPRNEKPKTPKHTDPFQSPSGLAGIDRTGPSGLPDMRGYGPGNMLYSALIRLDRIRGTAFEQITRRIIQNVPDYRIALDHTGLDPVRELDALFTASSRPQYIQHTFLAVRYSMPQAELQEKLNQRFAENPPWIKSRGLTLRDIVPKTSGYQDPRKVVLARQGLALIARPEWLGELVQSISNDSDLGKEIVVQEGQKRPSLIDGLMYIEEAMSDNKTLAAISARGIRLLVPGLGHLKFEGIKLALQDSKAPKLFIDIQFSSDSEAEAFAEACPKQKKDILNQLPFLVRSIANTVLNPLKCTSSGPFVSIKAQYSVAQINQIAGLALPFIPAPSSLRNLPKPPEPPAPTPSAEEKPSPDVSNNDLKPEKQPPNTSEDDSQ